MFFQQPSVGLIGLRFFAGPEIGPGQLQLQHLVTGSLFHRFFQKNHSLRILPGIHQRRSPLRIGARSGLLRLHSLKGFLFGFFRLIRRTAQAQFPLHLPGRPLHRGGILTLWTGLAKQGHTLPIVKSVQEQKPGRVLRHPRGVRILF